MKKVLAIFMAFVLLFSLASCSSSKPSGSDGNNETEETDTSNSANGTKELNYVFENPYFIVRFIKQEIWDEETYLFLNAKTQSVIDYIKVVKIWDHCLFLVQIQGK